MSLLLSTVTVRSLPRRRNSLSSVFLSFCLSSVFLHTHLPCFLSLLSLPSFCLFCFFLHRGLVFFFFFSFSDISVVPCPYNFPDVLSAESAIRVEERPSEKEEEDQEEEEEENKKSTILKKEDVFSSVLFFTVMLLFDEYMVTETITDFDERNTLRFYLVHMFPASSSSSEKKREIDNHEADKKANKEEEGSCVKYVEWDKDRKYTVDALAAYYEVITSLGTRQTTPGLLSLLFSTVSPSLSFSI